MRSMFCSTLLAIATVWSLGTAFAQTAPTAVAAAGTGPTNEALVDSLRESLRSQLVLMVADATVNDTDESVREAADRFRKKFPFLADDDGSGPFFRELVESAVAKTLDKNYSNFHERISKLAREHYETAGQALSPKLFDAIKEALPQALADLNTPQSRAEVLSEATVNVQLSLRTSVARGARIPVVLTNEAGGDPKLESETTLAGYAIAEPESIDRLKQESPEALRRHGLAEHTMEFTRQSTLFNIPLALIAVSELGMDYAKNPLAWDNFVKSLKDPATHVSFAAFMAANSKVSRSLQGVMTGTIPRNLLPFIGMSAGLVASSYVSELWHDKDVHACARSLVGLAPDGRRCEVAYSNWVLSRKIDAYLPSILSMSSSTVLSGLVQSGAGLARSGAKLAPHARDLIVSFRVGGLRLVRGTAQVALAGGSAGGPLAEMGTIALFLVIDKVAYSRIDDWWRRTSLQKWDLSRWLADSALGDAEKGMHLLLFRSLKLPNAEVSTMPEAHQNFRSALAAAESRGWAAPNVQGCLPSDMGVKDLLSLGGTTRRDQIKNCLVERDLLSDVEQLGKMNEQWRHFLLRKVSASSDAWVQSLFGFSTLFNASSVTYRKMIDELHAKSVGRDDVRGAKVDLSLPAFAKLIEDTTSIAPRARWTDEDTDRNDGLFPTMVSNTPTPELVDYVLVSMACGPDMNAAPDFWQRMRSTAWVPWDLLHQTVPSIVGTSNIPAPQSPLVETPFGSKFRFYPPAIVKNPREFCAESRRRANRYALNLPKGPNGEAPNRVESQVLTINGQTYQGILDYVVRNVNPELLGDSQIRSDFALWWDEKVIQPSNFVWDSYRQDYVNFLREELLPLFADQEVLQGCHGPVSACVVQNPKVTMARNLGQAFQVQLGYHKELGLSIVRSLGKVTPIQLSEIARRYDAVIGRFQAGTTTELDQFQKGSAARDIEGLAAQVSMRLNDAGIDEKDYRRQVLSASFKQLSNVLNEREQVGRYLNILKFSARDNLPTASGNGATASDPRARSSH